MKSQKTGTVPWDGALLLLGGVFLLGALAGSLCCARIPRVEAFFSTEGQAGGFWRVFWTDGALLGILFLTGLLRIGCLPVLAAMGAKGFLLAARATGWVLSLGPTGYGAALCQVLLPGFLSLAALLLLGRQALARWSVRQRFPVGKGPRRDGAFFLAAAVCLALTALAAAAACHLSPRLWQAAQTLLTAQ